jgi:hypothetical protein
LGFCCMHVCLIPFLQRFTSLLLAYSFLKCHALHKAPIFFTITFLLRLTIFRTYSSLFVLLMVYRCGGAGKIEVDRGQYTSLEKLIEFFSSLPSLHLSLILPKSIEIVTFNVGHVKVFFWLSFNNFNCFMHFHLFTHSFGHSFWNSFHCTSFVIFMDLEDTLAHIWFNIISDYRIRIFLKYFISENRIRIIYLCGFDSSFQNNRKWIKKIDISLKHTKKNLKMSG